MRFLKDVIPISSETWLANSSAKISLSPSNEDRNIYRSSSLSSSGKLISSHLFAKSGHNNLNFRNRIKRDNSVKPDKVQELDNNNSSVGSQLNLNKQSTNILVAKKRNLFDNANAIPNVQNANRPMIFNAKQSHERRRRSSKHE